MEASISIVLITLVGIHIAEEVIAGFQRFFNTEWFAGSANCPNSRRKSLFVDQIGLFLAVAVLALLGVVRDPRWFLVAVGIISADLVLHSILSITKKRYTPGIATCVLFFVFLGYFFSRDESWNLLQLDRAWLALVAGVAVITSNYIVADIKVRSGGCRPAETPNGTLR